jgi:hypothetical protein
MNTIHRNIDEFQNSIEHVSNFIKVVHSSGIVCGLNIECILFAPAIDTTISINSLSQELNVSVEIISYDLIPDNGIGKRHQNYEYISGQIAALERATKMFENVEPTSELKHNVLFLSFSSDSYPLGTPHIPLLFDFMKRRSVKSDLILLGKCCSMSTISDWHDLMVMAFTVHTKTPQNSHTLGPFSTWLKTFRDAFHSHANMHRQAFNLLDPRPALLEATLQTGLSDTLNVTYFSTGMISTGKLMHAADTFVLALHCGGKTPREKVICEAVDHHPIEATRKVLDIKDKSWQEKFRVKRSKNKDKEERQSYEDIVTQFDHGPNRYRYANNATYPKDFCWNTG